MKNIVRKIRYSNGIDTYDADLEIIFKECCILKIRLNDGSEYISTGTDFFECFKDIRRKNKKITYYCKGAKKNVLPSRMTRQMTNGLSAYETTLGQQAHKKDLVDIFSYEDKNIVSDPEEQDEYMKKWFSSL